MSIATQASDKDSWTVLSAEVPNIWIVEETDFEPQHFVVTIYIQFLRAGSEIKTSEHFSAIVDFDENISLAEIRQRAFQYYCDNRRALIGVIDVAKLQLEFDVSLLPRFQRNGIRNSRWSNP
jgi:hypothetical protein